MGKLCYLYVEFVLTFGWEDFQTLVGSTCISVMLGWKEEVV